MASIRQQSATTVHLIKPANPEIPALLATCCFNTLDYIDLKESYAYRVLLLDS